MSHGKRYTAKERKEILDYLKNNTYQETMDKFEVSQMSLSRWVKNQKLKDPNIRSPLLDTESQKELQIYLNLIESSVNVKGAAIVTAAGELIISEETGFQSFFGGVNNLIPIISNLLLCAQGFTAAVINKQKQVNPVFDDISIKTPIGSFLISGVGQAVLVTLFTPEYSLREIFTQDFHSLFQIKEQMVKLLA